MKKLLCILLALTVVFAFCACGGTSNPDAPATEPANNGSDNGGSNDNGNAAATGTTYDTGEFSVQVPAGWKEFPQSDVFSEEENAIDASQLSICKGGTTDWDLFSKPYIQIRYADSSVSLMEPDRDWYDEVVDLGEITTGSHKWSGFSCESLGYKMIILFEDLDNNEQIQATVYYETSDGNISLDDADVQAILSSITPD